jgi:hypothetical protein
MRKLILTLTALASLTIASFADPNDLVNASREEIETAAQNDAIQWYGAHSRTRASWTDLISIGEGRALKRGLRGDDTFRYGSEFESTVEAQKNAVAND